MESESTEARKAAAEAIFEVSSGGLSDGHDNVVEGFVTGALRNLCNVKDDYSRATLKAGVVNIIVGLLASDNAAAQSNAASLLARLMLAFSDSIPRVIDSGAVKASFAADALEAPSSMSKAAKKAVVDANGVPILIGAVVAPSKEC
ncbi:protein CELLULOSE SYNTHASE INTERACTIVE 3-like [Hibiscus syriacus]|uniref:protein CELLULOSE SYNTHASE INTERACTIVE 3-like n=1 Tax=Hibiscus syriacus TaxID=106335 RepID=UPI001922EB48|nr:protein CELLULOSE SYNTHASE INTERACTIVE 3-like [Hibiscus syriacus]